MSFGGTFASFGGGSGGGLNLTETTSGTLSSDQNTLSGATSYGKIRLVLGASIKLHSLPTGTDGQIIILINTSSTYALTLTHNNASGSDKKFSLPDSVDYVCRPNGQCVVMYDATATVWRVFHQETIGRIVPFVHLASAAVSLTITNAQVQLSPAHEDRYDFTGCNQYYICASQTTGAQAGTKGGLQYSLDHSAWTWADGTAGASTPTAYCDMGTASQLNPAGPFNLTANAKALCWTRWCFQDGGSTAYNLRRLAGFAF